MRTAKSDDLKFIEKTISLNNVQLFLLEDGEFVGYCGIKSTSGPLHIYERTPYRDDLELLCPKSIAEGPSEMCYLYIIPEHRGKGLGHFLVAARLLLISLFPQRFQNQIIASLRGVILEDGSCPFWDEVCKPFFKMKFEKAMDMRNINTQFIEENRPNFPICLQLLSKSAQSVVGEVYRNTEPAKHILKSEGFELNNWIDLFDAGPFMTANIGETRVANALSIDFSSTDIDGSRKRIRVGSEPATKEIRPFSKG